MTRSSEEVRMQIMKRHLLATIGLIAMSAPAMAADLPARAYKAPPVLVATVYDWTGFYIGINGGWGSSRNCWGIVPLAGATIADGCADRSGGVFGGQVGYRWQSGQFVFGLEGQGDWADLTGSSVSRLNPVYSTGVKVDALGLITGQIGYAWNASLFYLKGGAATARSRLDVWNTASGINVASASATRWGGVVGVGWEYGFAPNWSFGIEYDRLFMGDANNSFSVPNPILAGAANRIGQDIDLVTLRINYRFGGPGSVVAKY
ncbi:outer membrane protein [Tardiphaga sp. 841_E9_N1_2]|jgi:outer membrane immunogenic protein|uniref:outer membrane protein n=1 Tax=unclassified Tardiphaga TaxID=2631404 RepID=UPI003F21CD29